MQAIGDYVPGVAGKILTTLVALLLALAAIIGAAAIVLLIVLNTFIRFACRAARLFVRILQRRGVLHIVLEETVGLLGDVIREGKNVWKR